MLGRDFEQSETAKSNLQKVLEQFQWEKTAELKQMEKMVSETEGGREGGREGGKEGFYSCTHAHLALPPSLPPSLPSLPPQHAKQRAAEEAAAQTREEHLRKAMQGQIDDAQTQAVLATESADREKIKAKALIDQAKKESLSLRKALDEAISRLHSNESDVVPRQLIGNLMVSYYSQGRPKETLEIIARTLGFNDADRVRVGLKALRPEVGGVGGGGEGGGAGSPERRRRRGGLGGLFSRVGGAISSPRKEYVPDDGTLEGKSLGDLWLDYLMKETEEEGGEGEEGGGGGEEGPPSPPDLAMLVRREAPAVEGEGGGAVVDAGGGGGGGGGGGVEESKSTMPASLPLV